jgi:FMN phosphatase YigB (HAD superfamily)
MSLFRLISVDVGGTLGKGTDPTATSVLAAASPLPEPVISAILREELETTPAVTGEVRARLAEALRITWSAELEAAMSSTRLELFPGAADAVAALAELAPTVTLSNSIAWHAHHHETVRAACRGHLTAAYTSYELGVAKPDPEAFERVAAAHGSRIEELVHVGDAWQADVLGALEAGARAVWISAGDDVPAVDPDLIPRVRVARDITAAPTVLRAWEEAERS